MSTRNHSISFAGRRHDDLFDDAAMAGDYRVDDDGKRILMICPCGCGSMMHLPIYAAGDAKPAPNAWLWDGNRERPTLSPSIRDLSGCRFHGFLQAGVWSFTGDSGAGA